MDIDYAAWLQNRGYCYDTVFIDIENKLTLISWSMVFKHVIEWVESVIRIDLNFFSVDLSYFFTFMLLSDLYDLKNFQVVDPKRRQQIYWTTVWVTQNLIALKVFIERCRFSLQAR